MKNFSLALLALLAISSLSGCAYFGNAENDKDWYGVMGPERFDNHMERSMAREKLANLTPVPGTSAIMGYPGFIKNFSEVNANFRFFGPEDKSFLIEPKGSLTENLIPGPYLCQVYQGSELLGEHRFTVGLAQSKFLGVNYHWFMYYEPH